MSTPILRTAGPLAGTPRKEHGMGFSAPMVLANHDLRKHMTRRVVTPYTCVRAGKKPPPWKEIDLSLAEIFGGGEYLMAPCNARGAWWRIDCRYQVGDLIWQRETWATSKIMNACSPAEHKTTAAVWWRAGGCSTLNHAPGPGRWRPSIHMPRWASRSLYEIVGMRAERLSEISEADAITEGVDWKECTGIPEQHPVYGTWSERLVYRTGFHKLWQSINQKRGYPWDHEGVWSGIVWVIEYKPLVICGVEVAAP